ncbi:MAG: GIY-YIG nuclease family protein [Oscillospiraceae bacterium]
MVNVEIVQEWHNLTQLDKMRKKRKENSLFYVAILQKHYNRYLKIGTTERTIKERFSQKDYQEYTNIKILYVVELNSKISCYHVEDLTRSAIRELKGMTFVKNDRFKYFQLPEQIPILINLDKKPYYISTISPKKTYYKRG